MRRLSNYSDSAVFLRPMAELDITTSALHKDAAQIYISFLISKENRVMDIKGKMDG